MSSREATSLEEERVRNCLRVPDEEFGTGVGRNDRSSNATDDFNECNFVLQVWLISSPLSVQVVRVLEFRLLRLFLRCRIMRQGR